MWLMQELLQLEEDVNLLEEAYPQGEKVRQVYLGTLSIIFDLLNYSVSSFFAGRNCMGFHCARILGQVHSWNFRVSIL